MSARLSASTAGPQHHSAAAGQPLSSNSYASEVIAIPSTSIAGNGRLVFTRKLSDPFSYGQRRMASAKRTSNRPCGTPPSPTAAPVGCKNSKGVRGSAFKRQISATGARL
jgi:hypothetical protein